MSRHTDRRPRLRVELLEGRLPPAAHTLAAAEPLALGPQSAADVGGYLATPGQHDLYRVELGVGDTLRAAVSAQLAGSGLQPVLRVFDAAGHEVALNNQDGGDPELTVQAATGGSYFVGVSSAGNADYNPKFNGDGPGTTAGTYTLAVAVRKGQPLAPALVASSFRLAEATAVWGETVHATFSVNNRGGAAAGAFTVQLVASADPRFDPATATPLLPDPIVVPGLAAGGEWSMADLALSLPTTLPAFASAPADGYSDLFPGLGRLANGPIYLGLRIAAAVPGDHFGHRGADWESLTIVSPTGASARATADGEFQRSGGAGYSFTISPAVGAGLLTATARLGPAGELPQLILSGADFRQEVRVVVAGTAANPTATLSQYLPPGTYILSVAHVNALTPEDPENHGRLYDFHLDAEFSVGSLNSRSDTPLGDVFPKIPVTVTQAGMYTATARAKAGAHPVLSLYTGLTGDTLVYQSGGPPGSPAAAFSQYLRPGVYFLAVGTDRPDEVRLTTTFTPTSPPTETAPVDGVLGPVATTDFNNDGFPDLAVIHGPDSPLSGSFSILLGRGDGTYSTGFSQEATRARWTALAVGDLNADGAADLVLADPFGVVVYPGNGDGTFRPDVWAGDLDPYAPPMAVSVSDLNGDGVGDVVVAEGDYNAVRVLLADGRGGFRPGESIAIASPYSPTDSPPQSQLRSVAVADVNGDGIRDILATTAVGAPFSNRVRDVSPGPGGVAVLLGVGDGTFRRAADLVDNRGPGAVAVADANGDGLADVVVGNVVGESVGVFLGVGGGRFEPMTEVPLTAKPIGLVVGDFNRDGRPDLAAAGEYTVTPLLGDGRGGFEPRQAMLIPRLSDAGLAVADANLDGVPDLIVEMLGTPNGPAGLDVLRGNGDGSFRARPAAAEPVAGGPVALAVGDFNGDGLLDVATTLAREQAVDVRLGNGDGTYTPQASFPVGSRPLAVATADLNRDGRADLVVANRGDGTVGVLLGNGDGSFRPQVSYPAGLGPSAVLLTDVNGDGNPDVVVLSNAGGTVITLLGAADGTLRDTRAGPVARSPGAAPQPAPEDATLTGLIDLAAVDLNGDRLPDLVTVNRRDRTVGVRFGYGDGSFAAEVGTHLRHIPFGVTAADVDGDGAPDLVVRHTAGNTVGILRNVGNGSFDVVERTVVVDDPTAVAAADVNGDGRPDLVAASGETNAVSVLLADGRGSFQDPQTVPVGLSPQVLVVRDVNADGKPDVLVVNGVEGTLSTLLGRGDGSFAAASNQTGGGRSNTPFLVNLSGTTDAAGRPAPDSVVVDAAGNVLYRPGQAGSTKFGPPVVLNPGRPARDAVAVQTPTGWAVAVAERAATAVVDFSAVSLYTTAGGQLRRAGEFFTTVVPTRMFAADLTGRGRADVLVLIDTLRNGIEIVYPTSDGSYGGGTRIVRETGGAPSDVTFADFDGDGRTDIAVTSQSSGDVTILYNGRDPAPDASENFLLSSKVRGGLSPVGFGTSSSVSTVVGGVTRVGDNRPATENPLNDVSALTVDARGNVYFADNILGVVRRVDAATGVIITVAGKWALLDPMLHSSREQYDSANGGSATSAPLYPVNRLAVDGGYLFINEQLSYAPAIDATRRVDLATGLITVAEPGLDLPWSRAADDAGRTYTTDPDRNLIVRTDGGTPTTIAGALAPRAVNQLGLGVGGSDGTDVYFAVPNRVYRVDGRTGVISVVAGTGEPGYSGDGGPATDARLNSVDGITVGGAVLAGQLAPLYISDRTDAVIRRVDPVTGVITTVARLPQGFGLNEDYIAVDSSGAVYVADGQTVRKIQGDGTVATVAENRFLHALRGHLDEGTGYPTPMVLDPYRELLYFADGPTVRRVNLATGEDATVAGTGQYGTLGDGGQATDAQLGYVRGLALSASGTDLYVVDSESLLRVVDGGSGVISTVFDLRGRFDTFGGLKGLAVDADGNILVKGPAPVVFPNGTKRFVNTVLKVTAPKTTFTSAARPVAVASGDFTGGGRADLLVVNRGEHSFSVLAGDGAGGFAAPTARLTTSTSSERNTNYEAGAVVAGRFTRDSAVDDVAVLMRDAGEVWVFSNNGDGTFKRKDVIDVGSGATGLSVVPAAGGATCDLLVGNGAGDVLRLVGDGKGSFAPPPAVTGTRAAIAVQRVEGRAVALVANQQTNNVTVQARAAGTFTPVDSLKADDDGAQLAPGDVTWSRLSLDGTQPDAVVLASGSNSVLVYRATGTAGDGTPTFAPTPATYPTGTNPVHLTIADVNGDTIPDMLVANAGSNDVSVLFGRYGAGGRWVGSPGPRLRAGGAGPLSADLVANPASPGGSDLAITTRDGKVTVLPGRGQGFFDDNSPRVLDLGRPLAPQAPSYIPGLPTGFVVAAGGDVIRFNPAAGTQSVVSTGQNVVLVQAVDLSRVIEVRDGGAVVLATAGARFTDLVPRGELPSAPSGVAVLDFASEALEVLVTSAGNDSIYEYAVRAGGDGSGDPITFEIVSELTPVDGSSQLVPTLVTTISTAGGGRRSTAGGGFGLLDAAGATGLTGDFFARLGGQADDELAGGGLDSLLAILTPLLLGDAAPVGVVDGQPATTTREELLDGAAHALEERVEAVKAGDRPTPEPEAAPAGPTPIERLRDALDKLATDDLPKEPDPENVVLPPVTPPPPPAVPGEPGEMSDVGDDAAPAECDPARIDWRVVAAAAWVALGAVPLLHDPDRKAAPRPARPRSDP